MELIRFYRVAAKAHGEGGRLFSPLARGVFVPVRIVPSRVKA